MEVTVKKNNYDYPFIELKDKYKIFRMGFSGNLDLYWSMDNVANNHPFTYDFFVINKENMQIYEVFETLYDNIANCHIYDCREMFDPDDLDDEFTTSNNYDLNKFLKDQSCYKELYDGEGITWITDDHDVADLDGVRITKKDDCFLLEFAKERRTGLEYIGAGYNGGVVIRFRNSGSHYDPFNMAFMRMYNTLSAYNPDEHQIHIEEYLYQKNAKKH